MKNVLIITAHPSSKGFTHKIAENYQLGALAAGQTVKLINLYDPENRQDYFEFEDIRNMPANSKKECMQGLVTWADELVIIYPLWWFNVPAILKNFFDVNFSAGFAYKYRKFPVLKGIPVGMLAGKTARVFVTCDGSRFLYKLIFSPFKVSMKYFTLQFCGIKVKSFVIFDRMKWRDEGARNSWLENVKKIAQT